MYRLVYEAASHSPQLLTDLLVHRLADSQFDGLRARLERGEMMQATTSSGGRGQGDHHHHIGLMNTSRYWLDHCLLPVLQQALRSISILSTLFGYLVSRTNLRFKSSLNNMTTYIF